MKAISLWQPWATAIAVGLKKYETRSWNAWHRGPVAIHAAKRPVNFNEFYDCDEPVWAELFLRCPANDMPLGCLVAVANLSAVFQTDPERGIPGFPLLPSEMALGNYEFGRFAWQLDDVRPLLNPIPWKGSQGFFDIPDEVLLQEVQPSLS